MASFDKFVKLMMMTTSSHDGEVLNAIRMANSMLAAMDNNWEELLRGKVKMTKEATESKAPPSDEKFTDADVIDPMFEDLMTDPSISGSFANFVESVYLWWQTKGFLTEKQFDAISKAAQRRRSR